MQTLMAVAMAEEVVEDKVICTLLCRTKNHTRHRWDLVLYLSDCCKFGLHINLSMHTLIFPLILDLYCAWVFRNFHAFVTSLRFHKIYHDL